ncbi:hypothetical protein BX666DRAFT_1848848 [Dichotomocladium elegans]|nr:hypothetical protein BX666DRAFT_1848848 [Dichotomocladium elegans]
MDVIYSADGLLHDPPTEVTRGQVKPYLESPARLASIKKYLDSKPNQFRIFEPQDYSLGPILQVHEKDYIEFLANIYNEWAASGLPKEGTTGETFVHPSLIGKLDLATIKKNASQSPVGRIGLYTFDMSVSFMEHTWRSTYVSAQIALSAAHKLLKEKSAAVYALCRPPGHHATCNVAAGYCFINNVAVATRFIQNYSVEEMDAVILIIDIDYHHGNGTQDIFYDDPSVMYVSLHGSPDYPFYTGTAGESGSGAGKGFNINIPLNPLTTTDAIYLDHLEGTLNSSAVVDFDADLVIVSMGLDTWYEDPVAGMKGLREVNTYSEMGKLIRTAKSSAGRPVLFVQEGGYTIEKLGLLAGSILQGFSALS